MSQRSKAKSKAEPPMSQGGASQGGSSGRGRGKRASQEMEEDDYQGGSQMLSQGGRGEAAWATMSEEDKKVNTNKLINFLLERDADKVPAKRSDITDLFKRTAVAGRAPPSSVVYQIIERARKKLKHVYGFDIIESESNSISDEVSTQASQGAKAGIKVYMLRNVLKYPIDEEEEQQEQGQGGDDDEEDEEMKQKRLERRIAEERAKLLCLGEAPNPTPHYHLALCLMTAICLQRYSMTEKELWALMDKIGLKKSTQNHETFGKVEDAVKEIVAQGYLHVKKSKDRDGQPQINYCLGLRGEGEVTRLRMLNWAEHVFDEKMLSSTRDDLLDTGAGDESDDE